MTKMHSGGWTDQPGAGASGQAAPTGFRRIGAALGRYSPFTIAGGLWLSRHVRWRAFIAWSGGFPAPKLINRGGRFETAGCNIFAGSRFEVGPGAVLSVGKGTVVNRNVAIVCHERVSIGEWCLISWDVVISDTNEHERPGIGQMVAPVTIGNNTWIGCRAIILRGVTIGEGAVIGAGSVVTSDIPPYTLAAGQPARVIKELPRQAR